MRVDIPIPSPNGNPSAQTHSCSNPTELCSAILNQSIQHISQASDNPGAAGRLSDILPPFQSDHNTTVILQGALDTTQIDPLSDVSLFLQSMAIPESLMGINQTNIVITQENLSGNTAFSPSGQHLTHYKVLPTDGTISAILASMITLPFQLGFAPS